MSRSPSTRLFEMPAPLEPRVRTPTKEWGKRAKRTAAVRSRLSLSSALDGSRRIHTHAEDEAALDAIPLHRQGDADLYEEDKIAARVRLRVHPSIELVLNLWYLAARSLPVDKALVSKLNRAKSHRPHGTLARYLIALWRCAVV